MQPTALYRKAALEKLASPERLDVLMQVTSPRGWIALYTMGGVLFAVLVWSVFGSIPTRVDGDGILIRGGVLREVRASATGQLAALLRPHQRRRQTGSGGGAAHAARLRRTDARHREQAARGDAGGRIG